MIEASELLRRHDVAQAIGYRGQLVGRCVRRERQDKREAERAMRTRNRLNE